MPAPDSDRVGREWDHREQWLDRKFLLLLILCIAGSVGFLMALPGMISPVSNGMRTVMPFGVDKIFQTKQIINQAAWAVQPNQRGEYPTKWPPGTPEIKDSWGNKLNYQWPPPSGADNTGQKKYRPAIWSNGPNGTNEFGGGDDIANWDYQIEQPGDSSAVDDDDRE